MSYTEVAKEEGISRQGVYDMVQRCVKILEEYEAKLHLVEKFQNAKQMVTDVKHLATDILKESVDEVVCKKLTQIVAISNEIIDAY